MWAALNRHQITLSQDSEQNAFKISDFAHVITMEKYKAVWNVPLIFEKPVKYHLYEGFYSTQLQQYRGLL